MAGPKAQDPDDVLIAAVDLGSNSFHLLVARWDGQRVQVVDRRKEMVRIAGGLDDRRNLAKEAQDRAIATLERFGEAVAGLRPENVRAVGTNTFRAMRDPSEFIARAERALGHRIEVISGIEEGRLVYSGVAHELQPADGHQLVIDIGGGSTECVVGEGFEALESHSLRMGCVSYTEGFFPGGAINQDRFRGAVFAATNELQTVQSAFGDFGWERAIGSSGTIRAIEAVIRAESGNDHEAITLEGVQRVRSAMIDSGSAEALDLPGLSERRRPVFAGGVAILQAVLETLEIDRMTTSEGALREGLIRDLVGRFQGKDLRDHTVRKLQTRYRLDVEHADRVLQRLNELWDQVAEPWGLQDPRLLRLTRWAGALHEIGLSIAHPGYHKHGAYLLAHIDMPGFTRSEQEIVAALVLCHRRRFRHEQLRDTVAKGDRERLVRAAALLRLAVRLERSRGAEDGPSAHLEVDGSSIALALSDDGFEHNPLLRADLDSEVKRLERAGLKLELVSDEIGVG